jgi:putative Ca2+/H+ antiporter (TMEM165/GDT1 family)
LSVFTGAALAFVVVSGVGVAAGRALTRLVPLDAVRKVSGLILLGLGIWSAVAAGTG